MVNIKSVVVFLKIFALVTTIKNKYMGRKVKIYQTESYETYVVRESIAIDLDDYPELDGLSNSEIVEYLDKEKQDYNLDNLIGDLSEMDILNDKITNGEYSYIVEDGE